MRPRHLTKNERDFEGMIRTTARGTGYIESPDKNTEIKIESGNLHTALDGDFVRGFLKQTRGGEEGVITKIIERNKEEFVGTLRKDGNHFFLEPQNERIYVNFKIAKEKIGKALPGEKVVARLLAWDNPKKDPEAEIIEALGKEGLHETEMRAIVWGEGIRLSFPKEVENEAQKIKNRAEEIFRKELSVRKDLRNISTFTIDPEDAKDFDDALSIEKLANGNFLVGIHIADASFFVEEGSALDKEASHRGTSVYLVDRTIPMLPEVLSNDLCSLNEGEDKLTFSVLVEFSPQGEVVKSTFSKTVIRSSKRFSYAEAQKVLDTKTGVLKEELQMLSFLADKLRIERARRGVIEFEQDEIKFELDTYGKPIRVFKKERLPTHKLIEDFMIVANSEVARFMTEHDENVKKTFVYRVHELPDEDKIKELGNLLHALGHTLPKKSEQKLMTAHDINHILQSVEGKAHKDLVHMATLRSMAKAVYSTKNVGHFGLSLKHYTHFTSPIRRYPDILVHRLLFKYLSGKPVPFKSLGDYEALSRYATEMEITADAAQRASVKYKQAEYMKDQIGKIFDGTITGVTERGIFVRETETFAEGLVRLRDLKDDYYVLEKARFRVVGEKKKKTFSLGDKVRIRLKKVSVLKRLIDYEFV